MYGVGASIQATTSWIEAPGGRVMEYVMPKTVRGISIVLAITIGILCPRLSYAYGLRTGFGKVILEDVPMNTEYSMRQDAQFPLVIENNSGKEIELQLEVLAPQKDEIQEGYEAIPDTGWIRLEQDSFVVEPYGKAETDVIILVPYNEEFLEKKFHVFIWSHTIGESLGIGLKSKLLITIAE